jgi:hypothetical protein
MEEHETPEAPAVETPVVETPVVETPVVETPAPPVIPEGYVPATEVESERTARTAAEEARTAAETARADADTARNSAEARARAAEIREAARDLNFNDPSDAERFIAADATDFKAALEEVLKTKGYLTKQEAPAPVVTPTSPTNPERPATLTVEGLKTMTPAQVAANWPAVKAVLALQR